MSKKTKLHLIRGGKVKYGGGGEPPKGKGGKKKRRPNPLNKLLWYSTSKAVYPQRATSAEMIAERMSKLSKRYMGRHIDIAVSTAALVIDDCRRRKLLYGWMLMNVEKGSIGWNRGYVPMLTDVDADGVELFLIDDDDLTYAIKGMLSAVRTQQTQISTTADGMTFLTHCLEALGARADADRFREFAADYRTLARRVAEIAKHAELL